MSVEKTVLKEGLGGLQRPNRLSGVLVDVVGSWITPDGDNVMFESRKNATIQLDEARDELSAAMEDMLCSMHPGEESKFMMRDGYHLLSHSVCVDSSQLQPHVVPKEAHVSYILHLVSVTSRGKDVWTLTDQERLHIAQRHKDKGSAFFKAKNYHGASIRYSKAIKYLMAVDPDTPYEVETLEEHEKEIPKVRILSLLNLAACQLQLGLHDHVVSNCSKVLEVEPKNVKGLYRRAKALLAMKDFEGARVDLVKAKGIDPNQTLNELMKTLDAQETAHKARYKDALKEMFS